MLLVGNPGNKGGPGRPSHDLRVACRDQLWKRRGIAFLGKVMAGLITETVPMSISLGGNAGSEVRLVEVPVKVKDRLAAADMLMDRGYGKPDQHTTTEDTTPRPTGEQVMGRILELLPKVIASLPVDRKEIARLLAERRQVEVLVQGREIAK
jgi:hypothetical protein